MGLREKNNNFKTKAAVQESLKQEASYNPPKHYIDDNVELDAIERLKSNIMMLDDLQKRLAFMNDEIEYVIGTKKK